jgi:hypothetical protein
MARTNGPIGYKPKPPTAPPAKGIMPVPPRDRTAVVNSPTAKPNFNPPGQATGWRLVVPCEYCGRSYHLGPKCEGCGAPVTGRPPAPKPTPPPNRIVPEGGGLLPWWWWLVPITFMAMLADYFRQ